MYGNHKKENMANIPRARYKPESRNVTVSEFENILRKFPHRQSFVSQSLICTECGDQIIYCHGDVNGSYFKHNPSFFGGGQHANCSLFTKGGSISIHESKIQKHFVEEMDLSLNFEIKMIGGHWSSFITIPPFNLKEIENHELKKTTISVIVNHKTLCEIPINKEHFNSGEIKKIGLNGFPGLIHLNIKSSESINGLYCPIDGFSGTTQLYSSLILQDYISNETNIIDLSRLKTFSCKRMVGNVYTGKHYLFFAFKGSNGYGFRNRFSIDEAIVKEVILPKDNLFSWTIYDIVFKKITSQTSEFCLNRNCILKERSDAVIIWPPINSIGNYKYFKMKNANDKTVFLTFERDDETMDMMSQSGNNTMFFKVKNQNDKPFYVTLKPIGKTNKEQFIPTTIEDKRIQFKQGTQNYLFKNNVLLKRIDENKCELNKHESVISFTDRIEYNKCIYPEVQKLDNNDELIALIRYSENYVTFSDKEYDLLAKKYEQDNFVISYIDSCLSNGRIKTEVLDYLMEELL